MGNRKTVVLALICLVPLTIAVVFFFIGSDEKEIERVVDECRMAALKADAETVLERLDEGATTGGMLGEGPLEPKVQYWVGEVARRVEKIDLDETELEVDGDDARGKWVVQVTFKRRETWPRARFSAEVDFHRGPEGWRIRRVVIARP